MAAAVGVKDEAWRKPPTLDRQLHGLLDETGAHVVGNGETNGAPALDVRLKVPFRRTHEV